MQYALIKNGVVKNVIQADRIFADEIRPHWELVLELDSLDVKPGIGWLYSDNDFTPPPPKEESEGDRLKREARERILAAKADIPIQGVELQALLKDMIEVLF